MPGASLTTSQRERPTRRELLECFVVEADRVGSALYNECLCTSTRYGARIDRELLDFEEKSNTDALLARARA